MQKIKVAFFADCLIEDYDGAIRTIYQIIKRIPIHQFEFLFITGDPPIEDIGHEVTTIPSLRLPMNHNYKMSLSFLSKGRIDAKLASFAPDIIHISSPSPLGHFALNYAEEKCLPVITIYHTHYLAYLDYYFSKLPMLIKPIKNYVSGVMQSFYNRCDRTFVPTVTMKEILKGIGVFESSMRIWKRGIDYKLFDVSNGNVALIKTIVKNDKVNLLFSSRIVWEKNLKTLIEIYKKIESENLNYNLIVAGDGYALDELKLAMPNAVFLGHIPHNLLSKLYASADVFVFPSISETYGNVVAEAMASGLPCVIANGGGTADFIEHGYNGYLCDPNNANDYIEKIKSVLSNENLRTQFIEVSRQNTKALTWDRIVTEYFDELTGMVQFELIKTA